MSYLTVTPLMFPGDTTMYVDARTLFETYGLNGRFRDWVRRTLRVFLENVGAELVRYQVEGDSAKKKNYYFDAALMTAVVDACITPKVHEQIEDESPVFMILVDDFQEAVEAPLAPIAEAPAAGSLLSDVLQELLGTFLGRVNSTEVHAEVAQVAGDALQSAISGLNRLLDVSTPTPTVGTAVPAARAPEVIMEGSNSQQFLVRWHPYSTNLMYENRGGVTRRTRGYNAWCHKIDTLIPAAPAWFRPNRPLHIHMTFGHVVGFDVDNFVKSAIDALARKWGFNDAIVESVQINREIVPEHVGAGSGLQNGFIKYTISQ